MKNYSPLFQSKRKKLKSKIQFLSSLLCNSYLSIEDKNNPNVSGVYKIIKILKKTKDSIILYVSKLKKDGTFALAGICLTIRLTLGIIGGLSPIVESHTNYADEYQALYGNPIITLVSAKTSRVENEDDLIADTRSVKQQLAYGLEQPIETNGVLREQNENTKLKDHMESRANGKSQSWNKYFSSYFNSMRNNWFWSTVSNLGNGISFATPQIHFSPTAEALQQPSISTRPPRTTSSLFKKKPGVFYQCDESETSSRFRIDKTILNGIPNGQTVSDYINKMYDDFVKFLDKKGCPYPYTKEEFIEMSVKSKRGGSITLGGWGEAKIRVQLEGTVCPQGVEPPPIVPEGADSREYSDLDYTIKGNGTWIDGHHYTHADATQPINSVEFEVSRGLKPGATKSGVINQGNRLGNKVVTQEQAHAGRIGGPKPRTDNDVQMVRNKRCLTVVDLEAYNGQTQAAYLTQALKYIAKHQTNEQLGKNASQEEFQKQMDATLEKIKLQECGIGLLNVDPGLAAFSTDGVLESSSFTSVDPNA